MLLLNHPEHRQYFILSQRCLPLNVQPINVAAAILRCKTCCVDLKVSSNCYKTVW